MTERVWTWTSALQSERKPLVTLHKMTLGRNARSDALLADGTSRSVRTVTSGERHRSVCRCSSAPVSVIIDMPSGWSRIRWALARYWVSVLFFRLGRRRPTAMAQHSRQRRAGAKHGSSQSTAYGTSRRTCALCRCRHNAHYADLRIMPTTAGDPARVTAILAAGSA